jgi:hypothetical protein
MTESYPSGSHLSVLDTRVDSFPTLDVVNSKVASVRGYGGMTLTVASLVDLSVIVEWSADGIVFVPDLDRIISHSGGVDVGFYERDVLGEFVKILITSSIPLPADVYIQAYAKIRATGNFDNGVNLDIPVGPPQDPVWWARDPADPNEYTVLEGDRENVCACGVLDLRNQPDPTLDLTRGQLITGNYNITFDWQGKSAQVRAASFQSLLVNASSQVDFYGPQQRNGFVSGGAGVDITNTGPDTGSGQETHVANFTILNSLTADFWNIRRGLINAVVGQGGQPAIAIHCAEAPNPNVTGVDSFFLNDAARTSYLSDITPGDPGEVGCLLSHSAITRMYNVKIENDIFQGNFLGGTRVFCNRANGNPDTIGCFIATDHSNPNDTNDANYLQIGMVPINDFTPGSSTNSWHTRFSGGYDLWTDENCTTGLRIRPGTGTTNPICDARLKQDMVEYTDTASILQRVVACPVVTYHHKSLMEQDPVKEGATFRITPTAQAFNQVFHPEDGTEAEQIQKQNDDGVTILTECITRTYIDELERTGQRDPEDLSPLTSEQQTELDARLDATLLDPTPDCVRKMEKMTLSTLDTSEIIAALLLSVKELDKQVKLLQARCDALEQSP